MKIGTIKAGLKERDYMIERFFTSLTVEIHAVARDGSNVLFLCKKQKNDDASYQASTIFMGSSRDFVPFTKEPVAYYRMNNNEFLWLRKEDFESVIEVGDTSTNKERAQLLRNVEED